MDNPQYFILKWLTKFLKPKTFWTLWLVVQMSSELTPMYMLPMWLHMALMFSFFCLLPAQFFCKYIEHKDKARRLICPFACHEGTEERQFQAILAAVLDKFWYSYICTYSYLLHWYKREHQSNLLISDFLQGMLYANFIKMVISLSCSQSIVNNGTYSSRNPLPTHYRCSGYANSTEETSVSYQLVSWLRSFHFYRTQRCITIFTSIYHWSPLWTNLIQSILPWTIVARSILWIGPLNCSVHCVSLTKIFMNLTRMQHVTPIFTSFSW